MGKKKNLEKKEKTLELRYVNFSLSNQCEFAIFHIREFIFFNELFFKLGLDSVFNINSNESLLESSLELINDDEEGLQDSLNNFFLCKGIPRFTSYKEVIGANNYFFTGYFFKYFNILCANILHYFIDSIYKDEDGIWIISLKKDANKKDLYENKNDGSNIMGTINESDKFVYFNINEFEGEFARFIQDFKKSFLDLIFETPSFAKIIEN